MKYFLCLFLASTIFAAERKPVQPKGAAKPTAPFSHGILTSKYLYVSGQMGRSTGANSGDLEGQVTQALENVKGVVESAGLKMANVVSADVYLMDISNEAILDKIWAKYFPSNPPARSVVAVTALPASTPVEVSAIAVRDLKLRKLVPAASGGSAVSAGVQVDDRFFLSAVPGRDASAASAPRDVKAQLDLCVQKATEVLKAAGLEMRNLASATIYIDAQMPIDNLEKFLDEAIPSETATSVVRVKALPSGAHISLAGVASRQTKREGHCTSIVETVYCPARVGSVLEVIGLVKQDLQVAKTSPAQVVSAAVFLDSIDSYAEVNKSYAGVFSAPYPARVALAPAATSPVLSLAPATGEGKKSGGPQIQLVTTAVR